MWIRFGMVMNPKFSGLPWNFTYQTRPVFYQPEIGYQLLRLYPGGYAPPLLDFCPGRKN